MLKASDMNRLIGQSDLQVYRLQESYSASVHLPSTWFTKIQDPMLDQQLMCLVRRPLRTAHQPTPCGRSRSSGFVSSLRGVLEVLCATRAPGAEGRASLQSLRELKHFRLLDMARGHDAVSLHNMSHMNMRIIIFHIECSIWMLWISVWIPRCPKLEKLSVQQPRP